MTRLLLHAAMAGAAIVGFTGVRFLAHSKGTEPLSSDTSVDAPRLPSDTFAFNGDSSEVGRPHGESRSGVRDLSKRLTILEGLLPDLTEDQLRALLKATVSGTPQQLAALNLMMSNNTRELTELVTEALDSWFLSSEALEACIAAFERDSEWYRRIRLARVISRFTLHPEVIRIGADILAGNDSALKIGLLEGWNFGLMPEEAKPIFAQRLRELVLMGETDDVKVAAMNALNGDRTDAGVRFFLDRLLHDGLPGVRRGAFDCLPMYFVDDEVKTGLLAALGDPAITPELKNRIAQRLNFYMTEFEDSNFSIEQQAQIKSWMDPEKR